MNKAIQKRLQKFRMMLLEKNIPAAIVSKRENYFYLSGFTGTAASLLITQDRAILFTDFRYAEQARSQASYYEIIQYKKEGTLAICECIRQYNIQVVGFEDNVITYKSYLECVEKFEGIELVPLQGIIESLRKCKDSYEIEIIKKAITIADQAFENVLQYIKPGISEIEIAAELEYHMKKHGASGTSFDTIVATGERSSLPHGVASERKIKMGDVVTMDFGAIYKNYCSDITRTVFLGKPDETIKKIYDIVLEAQLLAIEGAKSGVISKEIDGIARDYITKNGYGEFFGHGLGHGVGLEIHEEPSLSLRGELILEEGMTVTIEPGIYIPGKGGVRIEDVVVVKKNNVEVLTKAKKELIIL